MSGSSPQQQRPARAPQPIIYSICIPRVFKNISEKRIRAILYSLKFGFVERVDMVAKTNKKGDEFWRVFVHFSSWNERNHNAMQVKAKLDNNEQIKVVYDNPWFWMISKSHSAPPEQRSSGRPKPFIDFSHIGAQYRSPPPAGGSDSPRSPSPVPTMPQRELTCTVGDPDYQEELN